MRTCRPLLGLTLLALVVAGCARQPLKPLDSWEDHRARMTALETWQISGKLGVRLPDNNGSARLRWHQEQNHYRIDLSGPFGQGRVLINGAPGQVSLHQGGEEPIEASSADMLIWEATGWLVPVDQLLYWVRGIPAPGSPPDRMEQTSEGLVSELEQSGWRLSYDNYALVDELWHLPKRIVVQQDGIRLTLVIYDWALGSEQ